MQRGLLIHGVAAGHDLAVVDVVVLAGDAVVVIVLCLDGSRGGAGRVLANLALVAGYVQTGGIGYVEDVELILEAVLFPHVDGLAQGEVELFLRRLTEDVALRGREGSLVNILRIAACGDGDAHLSRLNVVDGNLGGIDVGDIAAAGATGSTLVAGQFLFNVGRILDSEDGVHESGIVAEVNAADGAVKFIERIGFAALQCNDPIQIPVVDELRGQGVRRGSVGNRCLEVGGKDVGAVVVGRRPGVPQIVGIVAGEKQPEVALVVESMAPGVAGAPHEVMGKALVELDLEGIVSGTANRLEHRCIGTETDVGGTEVGVATVFSVPRLTSDGVVVIAGGKGVLVEHLEAIAGGFAPDGV